MNKYIYFTLAVIVALALTGIFFKPKSDNKLVVSEEVSTNMINSNGVNPLNTSYLINNEWILLQNGLADFSSSPISSSKIKTSVFGEPYYFDLNNDNKKEALLFLTQETGGSGTFFYVVCATEQDGKWAGTNGIFLGDRIAPQNITYQRGELYVNYADRKPDDSFAIKPSVGVSKKIKLENGKLIEVKK